MNGTDEVARLLAIVGLALSLLMFIWQLVSWRLSGARVRVEGSVSLQLVEGGAEEEAFIVIARNNGRLPIAVTQWAVGICRGRWSIRRFARWPSWFLWKESPEDWQGPTVPHTIPGHHSVEWRLRQADITRALERNEEGDASLHATVILATGRLRASKTVFRWPYE